MARECDTCGKAFERRARDSAEQWEGRKYCSQTCSNRAHVAEPIHIRFWRRVAKSDGGCWLWKGSKDGGGYGTIATVRNGAPAKAHRLSWEMRHGPIPAELEVCHKCDTPACVNPDHLFLGTHQENMRDCSAKGRVNPISILNLRPGVPGVVGAGQISMKERLHGKGR